MGQLRTYLGLLHDVEQTLAASWRLVADGHAREADVHHLGHTLAGQCDEHLTRLRPLIARYGRRRDDEPERLQAPGLGEVRSGPLGLLRDLQDLYQLASFVSITWDLVDQAGQALRDRALLDTTATCHEQIRTQVAFLRTRLEQAAPQALAGS